MAMLFCVKMLFWQCSEVSLSRICTSYNITLKDDICFSRLSEFRIDLVKAVFSVTKSRHEHGTYIRVLNELRQDEKLHCDVV